MSRTENAETQTAKGRPVARHRRLGSGGRSTSVSACDTRARISMARDPSHWNLSSHNILLSLFRVMH
jgi:hypothetical protein